MQRKDSRREMSFGRGFYRKNLSVDFASPVAGRRALERFCNLTGIVIRTPVSQNRLIDAGPKLSRFSI